jgi:hypothetical protein
VNRGEAAAGMVSIKRNIKINAKPLKILLLILCTALLFSLGSAQDKDHPCAQKRKTDQRNREQRVTL